MIASILAYVFLEGVILGFVNLRAYAWSFIMEFFEVVFAAKNQPSPLLKRN